MSEHATQSHGSRHLGRRLLASLAIMSAVCGGFLTGSAVAVEPAKCNTSVDKVCYAGYNAAGLKQIADDLSEKGKGSTYYAAMEKNLTDGVKGTLTLSDGSNLPFRLIGILHDDKADGSGRKAGLTFMAWNALPEAYAMNSRNVSKGGWRDSLLRNRMNNGKIWDQFPTDFQNNVTPVLKQTNNMKHGGAVGSSASATADKVWLVSYRELVSPELSSAAGAQARRQEGSQYEYFTKKNVSVTNDGELAGIYKTVSGSRPVGAYRNCWWERSPHPEYANAFLLVSSDYYYHFDDFRDAYGLYSVVPAFSF